MSAGAGQLYFEVVNWKRYQHYKERRPPWIKLYNALLDDYAWTQLPDNAKLHYVCILLLASRLDNRIPVDAPWIGSVVHIETTPALTALADAGLIAGCTRAASKALASGVRSARSEGEGEGEKRRPPRKPPSGKARSPLDRTYPAGFEEFWKTWPAGERKRAKAKAASIWKRQRLEPEASKLCDLVEREKQTRQWIEGYVPMPTTWLGQRRYLDGDWWAEEPVGEGTPVSAGVHGERGHQLANAGKLAAQAARQVPGHVDFRRVALIASRVMRKHGLTPMEVSEWEPTPELIAEVSKALTEEETDGEAG